MGLTHAKTADSHYNLGILYRLNFEFPDSLKQLTLARNIRTAGSHDSYSLGIAEVDYSKGHTESLLGFHSEAFVSFFTAAKSRVFRLGAEHDLSVQTLIALEKERHFFRRVDKKLVTLQIKDRLLELKSQPEGMMNNGLMAPPSGFIQAMSDIFNPMEDSSPISFPKVRNQILAYFQNASDNGAYDPYIVDEMCLLLATLPSWLDNAMQKAAYLMANSTSAEVPSSRKDINSEESLMQRQVKNTRQVFESKSKQESNNYTTNSTPNSNRVVQTGKHQARNRKPFRMPFDDDDEETKEPIYIEKGKHRKIK